MRCIPKCSQCPQDCNGPGGTALSADKPTRAPRNVTARFKYIPLLCGHTTTDRDQEVYSGESHPKGKPMWCEQCGHWVKRQPKKHHTEPTEPLY